MRAWVKPLLQLCQEFAPLHTGLICRNAMLLPGRLRSTTLGDLLGTLHRARASGTLELTEDRGRSHRVHMTEGKVVAVEVEGLTVALGNMPTALRRHILSRLNQLDAMADAQVRFRVAVRAPAARLHEPLEPAAFLHGRRRARDASKTPPPASTRQVRPPSPEARSARPAFHAERHAALHLLGLPQNADPATIKQTYRRLVRAYHPDLHPGATDLERIKLAERFTAITRAYQRLVA
ncbi:DnaJ domain-containing protein [Pendulispora albinea]|uniref:DnaJ domain-containing protein n=1 Tax=Pendulispora albinea TaxID=2741071 RepID=A0ABZ2LL06_9BACT